MASYQSSQYRPETYEYFREPIESANAAELKEINAHLDCANGVTPPGGSCGADPPTIHGVLAVAGGLPGIGIAADGLDGVIYAIEGNYDAAAAAFGSAALPPGFDQANAARRMRAAAAAGDAGSTGARAADEAGEFLIDRGFRAPKQVTPGTRRLEGEYINDIGPGGVRVEPWVAHYDEYGRAVARTDYNAANKAAGVPPVHHETYTWGPGCTPCTTKHIPGEYQP